MSSTLSPEERLERLDREVEELRLGFMEAAIAVKESPEVDQTFDERWIEISERVRNLGAELQPEDYDKEQLTRLYQALLEIRDLLDEERSLDTIDRLLICVERVRHVIRDAIDEHVSGVATDVSLVLKDIDRWLPHATRDEIAELAGVNRRTLARWSTQNAPPARRLRTVARLVAILRHSWTEDGIVAWFHRPRRDLQGQRPIALLKDPNYDEDALISAARAGRSQYAT